MIEKLYKKYFQKSKTFLYPALGIRKRSYATPDDTYLAIEGKFGIEDVKLVCCFKKDSSDKFKIFEEKMLLSNPLFLEKLELKDSNIYIFNLEIYENDYFNVIFGKYSKLSNMLKKAIKEYFGESSAEYSYVETYLYPEKFYEKYSELLDIDQKTLKNIGELCNPTDIEKETLKILPENLQILDQTS
jgi:hypothetical protein